MDPESLELFLVLVEELHFTRAARRLHMSQSSFSRKIQDLEASLHGQLAVRTTRDVRITEAGVIFAATAMRLLAEMRYTKELIATISSRY
jgi:DNA-binding transcriptional LysR family regulator